MPQLVIVVWLCQCVSVLCDCWYYATMCLYCVSLLLVSCDGRDDACSINTHNSWDCPLEFDAYHFGDNSLIHHFQHTWDRAMAVYSHHCWNLTLAVHWSSSHVFWHTSSCTALLRYTSLLVFFSDTDPFSSVFFLSLTVAAVLPWPPPSLAHLLFSSWVFELWSSVLPTLKFQICIWILSCSLNHESPL